MAVSALIHLGWLFGNGDVSGWRGRPASRTTPTFRDLKPDTFVEITEGADAPHLIEQPRLPSPAGP